MAEKTAKSRTFRGQSAEERRAERREKFIEAGIFLFGEKGFHGVTVRDLCAEAKLTERYFYESFKGLPELFTTCFAQVNLAMKRDWLQAVATCPRDPESIVEAFLRSFLTFISENPARARLVLFESISVGQNVLRFAESTVDDYANMMRGFIMLLFPDASMNGINTELLAHALVGANSYTTGHWMRTGFKAPLEEVLRNLSLIYRALIEHARQGYGENPDGGRKPRSIRPGR